ncbi:GrpB-like predicted nucleotidyltransferase (UPF0157 family) [Devosia subaequoris]|uniref:GrpB-like predicted nucleotidyltransferase (UPF0157 family) n=1 Tax=Devosia subaequoris TaxID=395930 RepID=A0A7W6INR4_9HYPH|nr:GrpB-like predicted nucleotidyltransferase (UPF0157 family) [Devosia subaequoris]MCP1210432.1 GrpB family protein [Devosia subaequoris]
MNERIALVDADPEWSSHFLRERERILACFQQAPELIEHMGSTAVPGLAAKPIIDIIALVNNLDAGQMAVPALVGAGYVHRDDFPMPDRIFLMKLDPVSGARTHQLHIHANEVEVARHLLFRDRLRRDPECRAAYSALKQDLAVRFAEDRQAYSQHKTAFIDAVVAQDGGPARAQSWNP